MDDQGEREKRFSEKPTNYLIRWISIFPSRMSNEIVWSEIEQPDFCLLSEACSKLNKVSFFMQASLLGKGSLYSPKKKEESSQEWFQSHKLTKSIEKKLKLIIGWFALALFIITYVFEPLGTRVV